MWFARLFGGRVAEEEYEEPTAAPPAPRVEKASVPAARSFPTARQPATGTGPKGFDPYNSGSFERSNAWERVKRR